MASGPRVLLVEDDQTIGDVLSTSLTEQGYELRWVKDVRLRWLLSKRIRSTSR